MFRGIISLFAFFWLSPVIAQQLNPQQQTQFESFRIKAEKIEQLSSGDRKAFERAVSGQDLLPRDVAERASQFRESDIPSNPGVTKVDENAPRVSDPTYFNRKEFSVPFAVSHDVGSDGLFVDTATMKQTLQRMNPRHLEMSWGRADIVVRALGKDRGFQVTVPLGAPKSQ